MKRSTTGLRVRLFKVAIATGHGRLGNLTGSTFTALNACDRPWVGREKRAIGDEVIYKVQRKPEQAHRRHVETPGAEGFRYPDELPRIGLRQHPRLVLQLCKVDRSTAGPSATQSGRDHQRVVEEIFQVQVVCCPVVRKRQAQPCKNEIVFPITQSGIPDRGRRYIVHVHDDPRISSWRSVR